MIETVLFWPVLAQTTSAGAAASINPVLVGAILLVLVGVVLVLVVRHRRR